MSEPTSQTKDTITILFCGSGYSASKRISRSAEGDILIKQFNAGKYFSPEVMDLSGIEDLSVCLSTLEGISTAFAIRGAPLLDIGAKPCVRRKVNFRTPSQGRSWVLIDVDKQPLPDGKNPTADLDAVAEHFVRQLPREFHDTSFHYQLSSSAGFTSPGQLSLHLWFWLSERWTDADLKVWAKSVNGVAQRKLVDPALFNDVQAHYTAAPTFIDVEDPFPVRSALIKKSSDTVTIDRAAIASATAVDTHSATGPVLGFEQLLQRVGDHPGGDGFHEPIIRAVASHVSTVGRAAVNREVLYETVRTRVLSADASQHSLSYVAHMASREHVMAAIDGALEKFGDAKVRRRSTLVTDVPHSPRYTETSAGEAHKQLSEFLDSIVGVSQA